jgi:hypothetical protein
VPPGPFRRQVGEASNAHAVRKPAIDGRFDQIGRKESQRDAMVIKPTAIMRWPCHHWCTAKAMLPPAINSVINTFIAL